MRPVFYGVPALAGHDGVALGRHGKAEALRAPGGIERDGFAGAVRGADFWRGHLVQTPRRALAQAFLELAEVEMRKGIAGFQPQVMRACRRRQGNAGERQGDACDRAWAAAGATRAMGQGCLHHDVLTGNDSARSASRCGCRPGARLRRSARCNRSCRSGCAG